MERNPRALEIKAPSSKPLQRLAHGLISIASFLVPIASQAGGSPRPNIVYINVDDLGVMDVGFNSPRYRTPNIDRLRSEGMLFTNGYAPAANCAPSRAAVFSGQYGPRHGVYTVGSSERGRSRDRKLIPIKNTEILPPEKMTLARALQQGGYKTIHLGKWHLGPDPTEQGFDINIGGDTSGGPERRRLLLPLQDGSDETLQRSVSQRHPPCGHLRRPGPQVHAREQEAEFLSPHGLLLGPHRDRGRS